MGNYTFLAVQVSPDTRALTDLDAVDLDSDGDLDIVSGTPRTGRQVWYENAGSFPFQSRELVSNLPEVTHLVAVDYDGDGDVDLMATHLALGILHVFQNDGQAQFTPYPLHGLTKGISAIRIVDVDADMDPDLVTYEEQEDAVKWYENRTSPTAIDRSDAPAPPHTIRLQAAYPNPFNGSTHIRFHLPTANDVELSVFSITGQHVRTLIRKTMPAGEHAIRWDGQDGNGRPVASGVWVYRLQVGTELYSGKMVLVQ